MREIEFTQSDVDSLGRKLSGLDLPETERALMSALLSLAANTIKVSLEPSEEGPERSVMEVDDDLPSIDDQLSRTVAAQPADAVNPLRAMIVRGTPGGGPSSPGPGGPRPGGGSVRLPR